MSDPAQLYGQDGTDLGEAALKEPNALQRLFMASPVGGALVLLVGLSALPFGSNHMWSASLLALLAGGLGLWWVIRTHLSGYPHRTYFTIIAPAAIAYLAVLAWAALQMLPLTPEAFHHPIWNEAAAVLGEDVSGRISVSPREGFATFLMLTAYACIFLLAYDACLDAQMAKQTVIWIAGFGFVYALYGLIAHLSGSQSILWYSKWAYETVLSSTFVNRNSYATYAGLGLLCAIAITYREARKATASDSKNHIRLRHLIERFSGKGVIYPMLIVVLAFALLLTESRAGILAFLAGLFAFGASLGMAGLLSRRQMVWGAVLSVAIGLFIYGVSSSGVGERLAKTGAKEEPRLPVYELTMQVIGDSPILGLGLGSFPDVYQLYRAEKHEGRYIKAHNTYLENASELGLPGVLLLNGAIIFLAGLCIRGLYVRRRYHIYPALGVAASALVGVHSIFDFSLQIPAVAATYALIMGFACAQSFSKRSARIASA